MIRSRFGAPDVTALLLAGAGVLGCEARAIGICGPADGCGAAGASSAESALEPCTAALIGQAERPLIDDFEDGDHNIAEVDGRGSLHRIYNNESGSAEFASVAGGAPNSTRAMRFSGNLTTTPEYGPGWGLPFGSERSVCPLDASSYVGVSFWARGALGPLALIVQLGVAGDAFCDRIEPNGQCFDSYVAAVSVGEEWVHYELPWSYFDEAILAPQPSSDAPSSLEHLYELQFKPTAVGPFSIEVDDVAFLVGAGNGVCDAERPSPSACCGNRACDSREARGIGFLGPEPVERGFAGLFHCPEDCAPDIDGCPLTDLGSQVPRFVFGHTALSPDDFRGSCNGDAQTGRYSPDAEYLFTAPETGRYAFAAADEGFIPSLYVLDGSCTGRELACARTFGPSLIPSAVSVALAAQQRVTVVVDGDFGSAGSFNLSVERLLGVCPDEDLGRALPVSVSGTTTGGENAIIPACGELRSPDRTVLWSAPAAGFYRFEVTGSNDLPVLEIRDGGCNGAPLACTRRAAGALVTTRTSLALSEGQTVAITVDGMSASVDYDLSITPLGCPAEDLGSVMPLTRTGNTIGLADIVAAPCGEPGGADVAFMWTAPADGNYVFDTVGSNFDSVLYVLDGVTCEGTLRACDDNTLFPAGRIQLPFVAGQSATIVVDASSSEASGDFVLNIAAAP